MMESNLSELDIEATIRQKFNALSISHQRIATFFLEHPAEAAFLPAARIADELGVSQSTVVRIAGVLGFEGFPDLQEALQRRLLGRVSTLNRLRYGVDQISGGISKKPARGEIALHHRVMQADMENTEKTMRGISEETFNRAIELVLSADRIYIIGLRGSAPLALALGMGLHQILHNTTILNSEFGTLADQLFSLKARDLVIGISYTRYARDAIRCLKYARSVGASTLVITDSLLSPPARIADVVLVTSNPLWFLQLSSAPLSLINALLVGVALRQGEKASKSLDHVEEVLRHFEIYQVDVERKLPLEELEKVG